VPNCKPPKQRWIFQATDVTKVDSPTPLDVPFLKLNMERAEQIFQRRALMSKSLVEDAERKKD